MKKKMIAIIAIAAICVAAPLGVYAVKTNNAQKISVDKAKEIALSHAGLTETEVSFTKSNLDQENINTVYDIEFYSDSTEYDYEINASTGAVTSYDTELREIQSTAVSNTKQSTKSESSDTGSSAAQSQITMEEARTIAYEDADVSASDVQVIKEKQDLDDGRNVYEMEFYSGDTEYDYEIDANSGDVIKNSREQLNNAVSGSSNTAAATTESGNIGEDAAKAIVLAEVPGASEDQIYLHLEMEDGIAVYEGSLIYEGIEYEFKINAANGTIINWESESSWD